jgi:hypothetical protein
MSDVPGSAPAPAGQAPESNEAPEGTSQEFDYRQSYESLRPEYTRATQELSQATERLSEFEGLFEALHDPDRQAEALALLGFEPAETGTPNEDLTEEWSDPLEKEIQELRETVSELTSQRELEAEKAEQEQLIEMRDSYIGDAIGIIEEQTGRKFSEEQERVLGNLAIANETEDGVPDVQTAFNLLYGESGIVEQERSAWIDTKTGAPLAPGGRPSPALEKPKTASERAAYVDERMRALEGQQ